MIISDTDTKIKGPAARVGKAGVIVLEAVLFGGLLVATFFLGQISVLSDEVSEPVTISYKPLPRDTGTIYGALPTVEDPGAGQPSTWEFAASKSGAYYYPKDCTALARVKPENRVYFTTSDQAVSAGYALSAACSN